MMPISTKLNKIIVVLNVLHTERVPLTNEQIRDLANFNSHEDLSFALIDARDYFGYVVNNGNRWSLTERGMTFIESYHDSTRGIPTIYQFEIIR